MLLHAAGGRLGYLAAPAAFARAAAGVQSQTTSGASRIAQHAGLAALALGPCGGTPVAAMHAAFRERRVRRELPSACIPSFLSWVGLGRGRAAAALDIYLDLTLHIL